MECIEAEELVNGYIHHSLKTQELEEFLRHIRSCKACYDELETYFIAEEAMRQLTEDGDSDMDFQSLLEKDLKKAEHHVRMARLRSRAFMIVLFLAAAALSVLLLYRFL